MKKFISIALALLVCCSLSVSCLATDLNSTEQEVDVSSNILDSGEMTEQEISASELETVKSILGEDVVHIDLGTETIGDFDVQTTAYVDESIATASDSIATLAATSTSGERGGVTSHTWTNKNSGEVKYKVYIYCMFSYNGTIATPIVSDYDIWCVSYNNAYIGGFETSATFTTGSTASITGTYTLLYTSYAGDAIHGTGKVECSKDGTITLYSENKEAYWI